MSNGLPATAGLKACLVAALVGLAIGAGPGWAQHESSASMAAAAEDTVPQAAESDRQPRETPDQDADEQEGPIRSPYRWIERSIRAGGFGGRLSSARGDLQFGPGPSEIGGGRFRARVSSPLSLEVGLGGGLSDRLVVDPLAEGGPRPVDSVPLRWLAVDAGFQLALTGARTWNRLHPYAVFGAGLLFGVDQPASPLERTPEEPEEPENGEENEVVDPDDLAPFRYAINTAPTLHAGVGTELLLSDRLGLALEARNLLFRLRTPEAWFREDVLLALEEADAPGPRESQWTNNLHLTLSFWYYF